MPEPEVTSQKMASPIEWKPEPAWPMPEPEVTSHGLHRVEAGSGCVRGRRASDSERAAARLFTPRPPACGLGGARCPTGYIALLFTGRRATGKACAA